MTTNITIPEPQKTFNQKLCQIEISACNAHQNKLAPISEFLIFHISKKIIS